MGAKPGRPDRKDETEDGTRRDKRERDAPATFTGDIGGGGTGLGADLGRGGTTTPTGDIAGGGEPRSLVDFGEGTATDRDAPEPPHDLPRSATEMAPGIPAGSGEGIDQALQQPDTDIGGGVAGDTTAGLDRKQKRDRDEVRVEDKGRTTL